MVKCSFCSTEIPKGTGKMYVRKDGRVFYFCSNKCNKNMIKLGRKPVKFKWTRDESAVTAKNAKAKPEIKKVAPKKAEVKQVKSDAKPEAKAEVKAELKKEAKAPSDSVKEKKEE